MILEGAMMAIALLCLTILHPGVCFAGHWNTTKWTFRKKSRDSEMSMVSLIPGQGRAGHGDSASR
jgi:carbon starvation protein CstA